MRLPRAGSFGGVPGGPRSGAGAAGGSEYAAAAKEMPTSTPRPPPHPSIRATDAPGRAMPLRRLRRPAGMAIMLARCVATLASAAAGRG